MSRGGGVDCRASNFAAIWPMSHLFGNHWTMHYYCEKRMRHFHFIYLKDWSVFDCDRSDVTCLQKKILGLD